MQGERVKLTVLNRGRAPTESLSAPLIVRLIGSSILALLFFSTFLLVGFSLILPGPAERRLLLVFPLVLGGLFVANGLAHALVCGGAVPCKLTPAGLSGAGMALSCGLMSSLLGPHGSFVSSVVGLLVLMPVAASGAALGVWLRMPARVGRRLGKHGR